MLLAEVGVAFFYFFSLDFKVAVVVIGSDSNSS